MLATHGYSFACNGYIKDGQVVKVKRLGDV
jgi:hypothetical protein